MKWSDGLIRIFFAATIAFTATVAAVTGPVGGFDLSWNTVDSGGGSSAGGQFQLSGTIGQADAGVALVGGGWSVQGGFWSGIGSEPIDTCLPDIVPLPSGNGLVNVDDLLAVINGWGNCANPNLCPADIAPPGLAGGTVGNDVVNVDDLLAVINGWGICP